MIALASTHIVPCIENTTGAAKIKKNHTSRRRTSIFFFQITSIVPQTFSIALHMFCLHLTRFVCTSHVLFTPHTFCLHIKYYILITPQTFSIAPQTFLIVPQTFSIAPQVFIFLIAPQTFLLAPHVFLFW